MKQSLMLLPLQQPEVRRYYKHWLCFKIEISKAQYDKMIQKIKDKNK